MLFSAQGPEIGGGHTFESDVLAGLLELAETSAHAFVLFSEGGPPTTSALPENVRAVQLPEGADAAPRESRSDRRKRKLKRIVGKDAPREQAERPIDAILHGEEIDLVWCVAAHTPMLERVPYIANVWDLQHRLQPWFPEVGVWDVWRTRETHLTHLLQRAAFVLTGTEVGKAEIAGFYGVRPERVRVLPQPTPSFARRMASRDDLRLPPELPAEYLFYGAQFWSHKNHVNLLMALDRLRRDGLVLPLVLTGSDKGNKDVVQRAVEHLGLSEQVHFLGFVERDVLAALYRNARMLTFVSCFGPDNLPPLEAMALGCPVIAADVPGAEEQLGDAALITNCLDPASLAEAIRRVHEDDNLRARLVERGHARAAQWTGTDYVRGVFGLLDEIAPFVRTWRGVD